MPKFTLRALNGNSQKTLEQRAREAGLPAAHAKKTNWPFLVAGTSATKPAHDANRSVRPS